MEVYKFLRKKYFIPSEKSLNEFPTPTFADWDSLIKLLEEYRDIITEVQTTVDYEIYMKIWNLFSDKNGLNKISKLTPKRISNIKSRLKEKEFNFEEILNFVSRSDFLLGKKTDWKIDFDFIFGSRNNYIKILEGKYNNIKKMENALPQSLTKDKMRDFLKGLEPYKIQEIQSKYNYHNADGTYSLK